MLVEAMGNLPSPFLIPASRSQSSAALQHVQLVFGIFVMVKYCQFATGNLLTLPFIDRAFDVVISYRLLPHVTNWEQLLSEMCRVAKTSVIVDYPEAS